MKTPCRCLIEGQKYGRWKPTETSVLRSFTKAWFHCLRTSIPGVLGLTFRAFFLILTRGLEHVVCLGESRLSQVNNSPRANVFPAGVANFDKAMYQSLERSTQDTRDGFFFVQCPGLIFVVARWSGPATSFWITSFEFAKVCGILGKLHWFLHLLLSYYYDSGMFIFCWSSNSVKSCVEWEHGGEDGLSCLLPCML